MSSFESVDSVLSDVHEKVGESAVYLDAVSVMLAESFAMYAKLEGSSNAQTSVALNSVFDALKLARDNLYATLEYYTPLSQAVNNAMEISIGVLEVRAPAELPPRSSKPEADNINDISQEPDDVKNLAHDKDYDPDELDISVKHKLAPHVKSLIFDSTMRPHPGRNLPRNTNGYGYVTFSSPDKDLHSSGAAEFDSTLPAGVVIRTTEGLNTPYLDTGQAIGLTYINEDGKPELRALAAAGMGEMPDNTDTLIITQIQAIAPANQTRKQRFRSGLHGGFDWRKTLVAAWEDTARSIGVPRIAIQSANNSMWSNVHGRIFNSGSSHEGRLSDTNNTSERSPMLYSYDDVAEEMGYTQDPKTGDWYKRL